MPLATLMSVVEFRAEGVSCLASERVAEELYQKDYFKSYRWIQQKHTTIYIYLALFPN